MEESEQTTEARYEKYLRTLAEKNGVCVQVIRVAVTAFAGVIDLPGISSGTLADYINHAARLG